MKNLTSSEELSHICKANGFPVHELQKVKPGVYRGTLSTQQLGGSDEIYVKLYSRSKLETLRTFVELAPEVGHPECILIEDGITALIMAAADGQSLSRKLPIVLLPGVWKIHGPTYRAVYREIGTQLGSLHVQTKSESGPVLQMDERTKGVRLTRFLEGHISDSLITEIQQLFEQAGQIETEYAITYGDRSPHNIFFDGSDVIQIDSGCTQRPIDYEHAGVVMGVRLMCKRLPYTRSSVASSIENAYWQGYTEAHTHSDLDSKAFKIRYIYRSLKLLDFYKSGTNSVQSKITKWIDKPLIFDEIEYYHNIL